MNGENWINEVLRERATIAPSLLASDFANLERELHKLEEGGVKVAHIDVMDGRLVPNISVGVPVVSSIRKVTTLKLDVHLMIVEPERYIEAFRNAGADSISIHIEASPCPTAALSRIRELGAVPGLVLNYGTPVEKILPFAHEADILLVMSVPAGFGGQKFHYDALESVRALRKAARPDALIEIDGGIDVNTIGAAAEAGVNLFVAGTSVFHAQDYGAQVSLLRKIALDAASKKRAV